MATSSIFHQFRLNEKETVAFLEAMQEKPAKNSQIRPEKSTRKRGEELLKTFRFR